MSHAPALSCPWCGLRLPMNALKIHVKYCDKAPRPRGMVEQQRRGSR
jgi:hypothetical protein